ncbi:MAG: ABC-type Mn2+/Zn2+ transport system permease subunit [Mariniblastus sp.]|jgi:ABC-type Mn2+/Zn2+ transport system permease subunit/Mn-dependent DtxR family transcriptional regulator
MNWFENLQLDYGHVIRPLIAGTLLSIVCSVVGCFIVLRKMSFLADAIAHSMFAGVIAGYLLIKLVFGQQDPHLGAMIIGAFLAGITTVGMVGFISKFSRISQDTAIGIMYTGIFALGAFAISLKAIGKHIQIDIYHYVMGSVLSVPNEELWLLAIVTSIVLSVVLLFYRPLQLTSFDPIMAASIGIPVLAVEYLLTACTSLVVVSGVQITGVILVVALIITPGATAYLLSDRLDRMIIISIVIGVLGFWSGFILATLAGAAPGASVVVMMTLIFLGTLTFAPRYGLLADWIRKSSAIPQETMEDVLGAILRAKGKSVPIAEIEKHLTFRNMKIRRAISNLARQDLLEIDKDKIRLTDDGRIEANRLVRAHRLWETYLEQAGTPEQDLHKKAHKLEHISDQATVEYLDDKLGHPIADPHGSEIPSDARLIRSKRDFVSSLLRNGNQAEIKKIAPLAQSFGLSPGDHVTMGKRSSDGKVWTLITVDGRQIKLNHDQADAIIVRIVGTSNSDSNPNSNG